MSCVFCDIVAGKAEASVVYEDDATLAFMNLFQFNDGHVLVIPKQHHINVFDTPVDLLAKVAATVKHVSLLLRDNLGAEHLSIWQSNGEHAGQEVWHLHYHILPRTSTAEWTGFNRPTPKPTRQQLDNLAQEITGAP